MSDGTLIYLSLGSNLGDRAANLDRAIAALPDAGVCVLRRSALYETEPVDFLEQPWFLNCVIEAVTSLSPRQLLEALHGIEALARKQKGDAPGPSHHRSGYSFLRRAVIHGAEIEIPHPRLANRRFVLVPLAELAPERRHPVSHKAVAQLLAATKDSSIVRIWQPEQGRKSSQSSAS